MSYIEGSLGRGDATASFEYSFATQGGTAGAKTLTAYSGVLPDNAVITGCMLEAVTTLTGGAGATVKLGITGNDDSMLAATLFSDAKYVAEAASAINAENPLKVSNAAGVNVLATIAVASLTAGRFLVHVSYIPGQ
jgi:hypothetical protein